MMACVLANVGHTKGQRVISSLHDVHVKWRSIALAGAESDSLVVSGFHLSAHEAYLST